MLVLTRKHLQRILIGDDVEIVVLDIQGSQVRLGINAPNDKRIMRYEVKERELRAREEEEAASSTPDPEPPASPDVAAGDA